MNQIDKLSQLLNIGPKSAAWLNEIGINTLNDLEQIGPIEAYRQVKARGHNATLNLVYALQGAIINCPWNHLPPEIRDDLRRQVAAMKEERKDGR